VVFEFLFWKTITLLHQPSLFILFFWLQYCLTVSIILHDENIEDMSEKSILGNIAILFSDQEVGDL